MKYYTPLRKKMDEIVTYGHEMWGYENKNKDFSIYEGETCIRIYAAGGEIHITLGLGPLDLFIDPRGTGSIYFRGIKEALSILPIEPYDEDGISWSGLRTGIPGERIDGYYRQIVEFLDTHDVMEWMERAAVSAGIVK